MKHLALLLALLTLLTGLVPAVRAEEAVAADLTKTSLFNNRAYNSKAPDNARDGDNITYYTGYNLTITAPEGETIGSVLLKWRTISPPEVAIKVQQDGQWVEIMRDGPNYAAQYIVLPQGYEEIRISSLTVQMELSEVTVLGPGQAPSYVQVWRDAPEKVDLMLFSTHPDDELLWFGGLLPYYAGEKDMDVLVVNAVFGWYYRRLELLDALWACGVDIYPVLLGYPDQQESVKEILTIWSYNNRQPEDTAVMLIRRYKPDVVVLHDVYGEYGHTAHVLFSQLGRQGVERAADAAEHAASYELYGTWDVPKTYIHLWGENQLRMDWNQPLSAFDGMTALEVAQAAMTCHASQYARGWEVEDGGEYDNALFGLWRSTVGEDLVKNDLFENIAGE